MPTLSRFIAAGFGLAALVGSTAFTPAVAGSSLQCGAQSQCQSAVRITPAGSSYYDYSCYDLWYARNAIYARQGYCFRTRRARRVFGARCYPPYGRLTAYQRRIVRAIRRAERRNGC